MYLHALESTLKQNFGYDKFRNGQLEIINSIMDNKDTLVVMPTGGGKSLCYQIPAIIKDGCAVVISPLIALMKDQVDYLNSKNIPATMINSSLSTLEVLERIEQAKNNKFKLLYIAPERLESKIFIEVLNLINISFFAIDEAHCISEWGHDFRPSYLNIPNSFPENRKFPIIALTATATPDVQSDIATNLKLVNPNKFIRGFARENLKYITELSNNKFERLSEIINSNNNGSNIIYCGSRKRVELFTKELLKNGINAEPYHGGMKPLIREVIQDRFIKGTTKNIVATSAFGMGIDKSDVRNVIHVDLPPTLEAYYQEAGRAGRDGKPSDCYYLYHPSDYKLQEYFLDSTFPKLDDIELTYNYLCNIAFNDSNNNYFIKQDLIDIANSLRLQERVLKAIFSLLEKHNILVANNQKISSKIQFLVDRERIFEYFNNSTAQKQLVMEAILRSVNTDVYNRETDFNLNEVAYKYDVKHDELLKCIESMKFSGLISFSNSENYSPFKLLKKVDSIHKLDIDFKSYLFRKNFAYDKLKKVVEYSETKMCKRNFILEYFEETDIQGNCNNCSSCCKN